MTFPAASTLNKILPNVWKIPSLRVRRYLPIVLKVTLYVFVLSL